MRRRSCAPPPPPRRPPAWPPRANRRRPGRLLQDPAQDVRRLRVRPHPRERAAAFPLARDDRAADRDDPGRQPAPRRRRRVGWPERMRVLVLQHEPLDGPGYLGDALAGRGAGLQVVRLDLGEPLPDPSGYDALLVLGGEMNVYQEA